ncbi:MAG: cysteine hydrolase [Thermoprotei archaeon]|nr:MAG: cysteine hydrolase [Thermoprotei archaeon]RLF22827.1 MAG: cysteine hydrolase [Thermoprotei archaeon]
MSRALLVIDMLNDFLKGNLRIPEAEEIVGRVKRLIEVFRSRGLPVIYVVDSHLKGVDLELKLWGDHALEGSWGSQVIDEIKPREGDYVVKKRRYSGFYSTDLDLLLRELGVDTLILTGVATDICVQHTAADAFFRGYKLVVVSDATAALSRERHEKSLKYMEEVYGASIASASDVEDMIAKPQP